jgi:hypothetical protein
MLHWIEKEIPAKIYLDIRERILYKRIKSSCKESFLGRERNPQRTPNSFFAGFFIKPRRVFSRIYPKRVSYLYLHIYRKLAKKERRFGIYKEAKDVSA